MQTRFINRANLLGMSISGLGLIAFALWAGPDFGHSSNPLAGSEPSFLEGWWNAGQGKGFPWPGKEPLVLSSESQAFSQLISDRVRPGFWSEDEILELSNFILAKSEQYEVSPFLILSLIDVESRYEPHAISRRGAVGLMQLLPATAEEVATSAGLIWHPSLLTDPKANIELGLKYMAKLKRQFSSLEQVLTAYNIGPGALRDKLNQGQDVPLEYFYRVKSRMADYRRKVRLPHARAKKWDSIWL